jgi:hypothetical protein
MWAAGDDYWKPEFIMTLLKGFESNPSAGVAQCAIRRENIDGSLIDIIEFNGKNNPMKLSHWQVASRLLSPSKNTRMKKYNQFIYGLFKYDVISKILAIDKSILNYGDRAFVALAAMTCRFIYVDKILFHRTVKEPYTRRYPNDDYKKGKNKITNLRYYSKSYYKLTHCIIYNSDIPLQRKLFVIIFLYYVALLFIRRQKKKKIRKITKKIRKLFYGKKR